ncbi:DUF4230 domain-containing protein [Blastomonas sp.]|uniref:DUF4230 domain-containing protein n=1 Tax=Blastomonas sp. TaxID=1909299 RepID=UPI0035937836
MALRGSTIGLMLFAAVAVGAGGTWLASGLIEDKTEISAEAMLAGFERTNQLVVLIAQVVPVVTNKDPGFIGMFDSEQTAIIPATVSYSVNMARLDADAIVWNETKRTMTITLPPIMIQPPNLQEQQARYYRDGLWVTGQSVERLFKANSASALKQAKALARNESLVAIARASARDAITHNAKAYLSGAGMQDAVVTVKIANQGANPQ